MVGKTAENCRQLAVRARRHVAAGKPRFQASRTQREALADRFFAAMGTGDIDGLVTMLTEDVVVHGDSGGTRPNWPRPIAGRARVIRLLRGLAEDMRRLDVRLRRTEINGQPGAVFTDPQGRIITVMVLDIADGEVQTVRSVINPEKLRHLGPLADVGELLRQRNEARGS